jgi:hypothetical protein
VSWSLRFAEPIVLDDGVKRHCATLSRILTLAAEQGGPVEFARIATLQALNRHARPHLNSEHKSTHWGSSKLKRDTA